MAVCWTDFIQGIMMFFAIVIVPAFAMYVMGGVETSLNAIDIVESYLFQSFHES